MSILTQNRSQSFTSQVGSSNELVPRVHLQQESEGYRLEVEMPGVSKTGVELTVEDGLLTIEGKREPNNAHTLYSERLTGNYRRVFALDPQIDPNTIRAQMEQGLLTVRLQKSEALKPRKVAVG